MTDTLPTTTESVVAIKAIQEIRKDDIVIAFMGPTGVGKSYFIDLLTGQIGRRAGSTLKSVTEKIQATRVHHRKYGKRIVLVDTPGFDDTTRTDMEILAMISEWLVQTYKSDVKLSGLIYLHRITDNRMGGSPFRNLRMFGNLCGDLVMSRVVLVSTMWDNVNLEAGEKREGELKQQFWQGFIERGSMVDRLKPSNGEEAWRIVDALIENSQERDSVLLQEELVDLKRRLNETEAGKTLYTSLQLLLAEQKNGMKTLLGQLDSDNADPKLKKSLEKEYKKVEQEFQKTFNEVNKLKIPLGRRIIVFLSWKRAHAKAIKMVPQVPFIRGGMTAAAPEATQAAFHSVETQSVGGSSHKSSKDGEQVYATAPAGDSTNRTPFPRVFNRARTEDTIPEIPESIRALMSGILKTSIQPVADTLATNIRENRDAQELVDFLDVVLRGQQNATAADQQNRVLTLLSKVVASSGVIPRYLKLKKISHQTEPSDSGSYGNVYRGSNDKSVAIKVTDFDHSSSAYIKELILWSHTSHSNILPLYGVFFVGREQIGLVSPWMKAGNLHDYVATTKDTQSSRLPLIIDLTNGLSHLHRLGIVHSDLKGENILLSDDKRALIADFGSSHISTRTATIKTRSPITYTPHFAAPEALFGNESDQSDHRDRPTWAWDIWSFGGLCYQVLSRQVPFQGLKTPAIIARLMAKQLPQKPSAKEGKVDEIDEDKWGFLTERCWAWDHGSRPQCKEICRIINGWNIQDDRGEPMSIKRPSTIPFPQTPKINMGRLEKILLNVQAQLVKSTEDRAHN